MNTQQLTNQILLLFSQKQIQSLGTCHFKNSSSQKKNKKSRTIKRKLHHSGTTNTTILWTPSTLTQKRH